MKSALFLIFFFLFFTEPSGAQSEALALLLKEAKHSLTHPDEIKATAKKIQDYFSNPTNKSFLDTPEAQELAKIQYRFFNYLKLNSVLTGKSCNIDNTPSARTKEILYNAPRASFLSDPLKGDSCYSIHPDYFVGNTELTALVQDSLTLAEEVTERYAVDERGKLLLSSELSPKEQEKYEWTSNMDEMYFAREKGSQENIKSMWNYQAENPEKDFMNELYRQSLDDTFDTHLQLLTTYGDSKLGPYQIAYRFCAEGQSKKCPEEMRNYFVKKAEKAIKERKKVSYESAAEELNTEIAELNKVRERLRKNSTWKTERGGDRLSARWIDEAEAKKDYAEYSRLYHKMVSSGPGLFVATDELSGDLSEMKFNPGVFYAEPYSYSTVSAKKFKSAVEEAQALTSEHGEELLKAYHQKPKVEHSKGQQEAMVREKIQSFMKLNPAAAAKVLINNPDYAQMACSALRSIALDEGADKQLRLVAKWGGFIVGGALVLTGVGAVAGAEIIGLGTAGAVAAAPELALNYGMIQDMSTERTTAIVEQDGTKAQKINTEIKKEKTQLVTDVFMSGTGIMMEINQSLRLGKIALQETSVATKAPTVPVKAIAGNTYTAMDIEENIKTMTEFGESSLDEVDLAMAGSRKFLHASVDLAPLYQVSWLDPSTSTGEREKDARELLESSEKEITVMLNEVNMKLLPYTAEATKPAEDVMKVGLLEKKKFLEKSLEEAKAKTLDLERIAGARGIIEITMANVEEMKKTVKTGLIRDYILQQKTFINKLPAGPARTKAMAELENLASRT